MIIKVLARICIRYNQNELKIKRIKIALKLLLFFYYFFYQNEASEVKLCLMDRFMFKYRLLNYVEVCYYDLKNSCPFSLFEL